MAVENPTGFSAYTEKQHKKKKQNQRKGSKSRRYSEKHHFDNAILGDLNGRGVQEGQITANCIILWYTFVCAVVYAD